MIQRAPIRRARRGMQGLGLVPIAAPTWLTPQASLIGGGAMTAVALSQKPGGPRSVLLVGGVAGILYWAYVSLFSASASAGGGLFSNGSSGGGLFSNLFAPAPQITVAPLDESGITAGAGPSAAPGFLSVGAKVTGATAGAAGAAAAAGSTSAFAAAAPLLGIAAGVVAVAAIIAAIISAHHAAAVKLEADTLNNAVPHFNQGLIALFNASLPVKASPLAFDAAVNAMVSDYYMMVAKIIKGRWANGPGTWPSNSNEPNPCNGPCEVGHYWIEGHATPAKIVYRQLLSGAINNFTFSSTPAHAGFAGFPAFSVSV